MSIEQTDQTEATQNDPTIGIKSLELVLNLMAHSAGETAAMQNGVQDYLVDESRQLAGALLRARGALEAAYKVAKHHGDYKIEAIVGQALYETDDVSYRASMAVERDWSSTKN